MMALSSDVLASYPESLFALLVSSYASVDVFPLSVPESCSATADAVFSSYSGAGFCTSVVYPEASAAAPAEDFESAYNVFGCAHALPATSFSRPSAVFSDPPVLLASFLTTGSLPFLDAPAAPVKTGPSDPHKAVRLSAPQG